MEIEIKAKARDMETMIGVFGCCDSHGHKAVVSEKCMLWEVWEKNKVIKFCIFYLWLGILYYGPVVYICIVG